MTICNKLYRSLCFAAALGLMSSVSVLAGDIDDMPEDQEGAMFSHQLHVVDMELDCDSCHTDVFEMEIGAAEAKGDFTMAALEAGQYCGVCHDGDTAFGVKDETTCVTCHGSDMKQPKTIIFNEPVKAVTFNHEMHTEDFGLECSSCHTALFKMKMGDAEATPDEFTMEALYAGKYCGACHNGDDAFASNTKCTTCHIGVKGFERLFGNPKEGEATH